MMQYDKSVPVQGCGDCARACPAQAIRILDT